jgi:hypothetical protein
MTNKQKFGHILMYVPMITVLITIGITGPVPGLYAYILVAIAMLCWMFGLLIRSNKNHPQPTLLPPSTPMPTNENENIAINKNTTNFPSTTHQLANHPLPNTAVTGEIKINGITIQNFSFNAQDSLAINITNQKTHYVWGGTICRNTGTIIFLWGPNFFGPTPPINTIQVIVNYQF